MARIQHQLNANTNATSYVSLRSASHSFARWANSEVAFCSLRSRCALQLCTAGDDADDLDADEAGVFRLGVTGARDAGDADGTGG